MSTDLDPRTKWSPSWQLGFLVFLLCANIAALLAIPWLFSILKAAKAFSPEIVVSVVVIAGAALLVLGLATTAVIFRHLRLANKTEPMGLPSGSIRALIALMLILIFTFVSVFLITNVDTATGPIDCLTLDDANAIPIEQVQSRLVSKADCGNEDPYFVVVKKDSTFSEQLSQQLMTTLGTLVVAIASFYFGSQAVMNGRRKSRKTVTPKRSTAPDESKTSNTAKSAGESTNSVVSNTSEEVKSSDQRTNPVESTRAPETPPASGDRAVVNGVNDTSEAPAKVAPGNVVVGEDQSSVDGRLSSDDPPPASVGPGR